MIEETSLTLYEKELVCNAGILHAKNNIIRKVSDVFAIASTHFVDATKHKVPGELTAIPPKISRGEQYLGLPYVMLDYPRNFTKQNTFAIRTFFWWGHFFSIHLQLSGYHKQQHAPAIITAISKGHFDGWHIGVSDSEWHHHFEADNYLCIANGKTSVDLLQVPFIKLAKKIPLSEWDTVQIFLRENFFLILKNLAF